MRGVTTCFLVAAAALPAAADTVTTKSGKKLEGVIVSSGADGDPVVVNPYNSRCPEMTYGITDKEKFAGAKVEIADPPLVEYRERASIAKSAADHLDLAKLCEKHKFAEERDRELKLTLCAEPDNTEALAAIGRSNWAAWAKGNPLADPDIREHEATYVKRDEKGVGLAPAELQAEWSMMTEKGTTRSRAYLERARRSAKFPLGRRDKVPLTVRSELSPGATYCIYLPKSYDPLVPTGLVVALHGGGQGAKDIVTGNGEEAMNFYVDVADERGVIVVCPSALQAPWSGPKNVPLVDAVIDEMKMLYNVDENRIWLTGHSMGGWGSWWWGPQRATVWAAFAPCAGGGGSAADAKDLPVYIYHGADDQICVVTPDRAAAEGLKKEKADFVYTEVNNIGHGFPDWVRHDIFRFFTGRWKDDGKKRAVWPRSSFDRKATKDEVKCFGDPAAVSSAAPAGGDDAKLADLIASLEKGGGRGVEAAKELATRKDAATLTAVAHVLHSKKSLSDTKVLAAKTIGDMGLADGVKALAPEVTTDDFRVLDSVVEALGAIGGKDALDPLAKAGRQYGLYFEKGTLGGEIGFTEYETRCQSFSRLCDAFAKTGDAGVAIPVIEKEIVGRVFAPAKAYTVPIDERFVEIPPRARRELMEHLAACFVALKDPRGRALLTTAKTAWAKEAPLVAAADDAIGKL